MAYGERAPQEAKRQLRSGLAMLAALVELTLVIVLGYVLPIVHVMRSDRTEPQMRTFWVVVTVCFGLAGYFFWWIMTTAKAPKGLEAASLPPFPVRSEGEATLYIMRWAFWGRLLAHTLYLDDRSAAPVAVFRGSR